MINKKSSKQKALTVFLYILLAFLSFVMLLPFFWMLSSSFKYLEEIFISPVHWIPEKFTFDNYKEIFEVSDYINFGRGFLNTMFVVLPPLLIGVFLSALAAFGYSRMHFPGRDKIFFIFIPLTK